MDEATERIDAEVSAAWATIDRLVDGFFAVLPKLVIAAVVFALFALAAWGVRAAVARAFRYRGTSNLGLVLGRLAQWALVLLGLLVAVTIVAPSVRPVDLLSLLGIGGVAIGFAFKDILQNFLAGILILLRQPFRVGDQIVFGNHEGTVEAIETRSTHVRTYDGRRVVIPNGEIYTKSVVVNTAYPARRSEHDVGVGYGDDLRGAADVILAAVRSVDGVLAEPAPEVIAMELAPSSVNVRALWWTAPRQAEVLRARHGVITAIRERLGEAAIDIPFPTQMVLFHDQTEAADGDRTRQREGWPGREPTRPRTLAGPLREMAEAVGGGGAGHAAETAAGRGDGRR